MVGEENLPQLEYVGGSRGGERGGGRGGDCRGARDCDVDWQAAGLGREHVTIINVASVML